MTVFSGISVDVYAEDDDVETVRLTTAQTLALFGETLEGEYFDGKDYVPCEFKYHCNYSTQYNAAFTSNQRFLVYYSEVSATNSNFYDYSLKISPSIDLRNLQRFDFSCGISASDYITSITDYPNMYLSYSIDGVPSKINFISSGGVWEKQTLYGKSTAYANRSFPQIFFVCRPSITNGSPLSFNLSFDSVYSQVGFARRFVLDDKDTYVEEDDESTVATLFFIECPLISAGYEVGSGSGSGGDESSSGSSSGSSEVDRIVDALDKIAQAQQPDMSEKGPLKWIGEKISGLALSLLEGIKSLFVPGQDVLYSFFNSIDAKLRETFGALYDVEELTDKAIKQLLTGSAVESIKVDAITIDLPEGAQFTIGGWSVPLRPEYDKFHLLYEALAKAIDIVAALAFVNMLRNKLETFLTNREVHN